MNKKQPITEIAGILLIVLAAATGLIMLSQASVGEAFAMFVRGIFGNKNSFFEIFVKATPLIFTSLGCAVAFRSGFFNIGAEGQLYVGALAAAMVALGLPEVAGWVRIPLAFLAGFIGGGVWCFLAAIVKEKLRISEIIVTIMLNYIGINLVGIAVRTFLMDPAGSIPQSAKIDPSAVLPLLMPPARLNAGFLAALAAVGIVRFLLEKTTLGFEIKAVGFNKRASACNGISTLKNIAAAAVLSGGLAGLAGVVEVLGVQKKLVEGISGNSGYTAVLIALLAANNPIGACLAAIGYAALQVGANSMQRQLGIPSSIVDILMGLVVLLIMARGQFHRRRRPANAQ